MLFTQIIAFKSYLDNLGKPLNSTLMESLVDIYSVLAHNNQLLTGAVVVAL